MWFASFAMGSWPKNGLLDMNKGLNLQHIGRPHSGIAPQAGDWMLESCWALARRVVSVSVLSQRMAAQHHIGLALPCGRHCETCRGVGKQEAAALQSLGEQPPGWGIELVCSWLARVRDEFRSRALASWWTEQNRSSVGLAARTRKGIRKHGRAEVHGKAVHEAMPGIAGGTGAFCISFQRSSLQVGAQAAAVGSGVTRRPSAWRQPVWGRNAAVVPSQSRGCRDVFGVPGLPCRGSGRSQKGSSRRTVRWCPREDGSVSPSSHGVLSKAFVELSVSLLGEFSPHPAHAGGGLALGKASSAE
ncbi:ERI1 exoribonuclease 3 [Chelonia mydas]|uniref:ERI1 exoribonuclease 3 n=1 Tax=Chelonia mydas TaxID=8469 RepID=M7BQ38_CHEMY|nr:ERI1 exoribonuclease 3 [Chelonia mydas]